VNNDHENQISHFEERAKIGDSGNQNNEDNICNEARFQMIDLEKFS